MQSFISKPEHVKAEQWFFGSALTWVEQSSFNPTIFGVYTRDGWCEIFPGDWLVKHHDEKLSVYSPVEFEQRYEAYERVLEEEEQWPR